MTRGGIAEEWALVQYYIYLFVCLFVSHGTIEILGINYFYGDASVGMRLCTCLVICSSCFNQGNVTFLASMHNFFI